MNLTAGVAGPLLDIFFVRTALTRHAIVATKAATQVFSHLMKIMVYGAPLLAPAARACRRCGCSRWPSRSPCWARRPAAWCSTG